MDELLSDTWTPALDDGADEVSVCGACPMKNSCHYPLLCDCPSIKDVMRIRAEKINKIRKLAGTSKSNALSVGKPLVGTCYSRIYGGTSYRCKVERSSYDVNTGMLNLLLNVEIFNRKQMRHPVHKTEEINLKDVCNIFGTFDLNNIRKQVMFVLTGGYG